MKPTPKSVLQRVGEMLIALGNIPLENRGPDYRIACGLIKEAQGHLYLRDEKQAERFVNDARPYLKQIGIQEPV